LIASLILAGELWKKKFFCVAGCPSGESEETLARRYPFFFHEVNAGKKDVTPFMLAFHFQHQPCVRHQRQIVARHIAGVLHFCYAYESSLVTIT